jgi:putative flippase GtrA
VQLAGLGVTELLLWLLVSTAGLEKIAGYVLTAAVVTCATFLANRTWAFAT